MVSLALPRQPRVVDDNVEIVVHSLLPGLSVSSRVALPLLLHPLWFHLRHQGVHRVDRPLPCSFRRSRCCDDKTTMKRHILSREEERSHRKDLGSQKGRFLDMLLRQLTTSHVRLHSYRHKPERIALRVR